MTPRTLLAAAAAIAAATVALAGCSSPVHPLAEFEPATRLVGMWHVTGVADDRSWLRVDDGSFALWVDCGIRAGSWEAVGTSVVAAFTAFYSDCDFDPQSREGSWLLDVERFAEVHGRMVLYDERDTVVATLEPGRFPPTRFAQPELLTTPQLSEQRATQFDKPLELRGRNRVVDELVGTWIPEGLETSTSFIRFAPDGTVEGQDGCNVFSDGRWVQTSTGEVLVAGLQVNALNESDDTDISSSPQCRYTPFPFNDIGIALEFNGRVGFGTSSGELIAWVTKLPGSQALRP